mgnify:CR=1 FL=1
MMPAFIDTHSHFAAVANEFLQVSLTNCTNFKEIQSKLLQYKMDNQIPDGKWIIARGYDFNWLKEKRNITKNEIDEVLPNNPVVIKNQSEHNGIMNSFALRELNITNDTDSPIGGKIEKINNELTGYLEENAFIENLKRVPMPRIDELQNAFLKAEQKYASNGITTAQEGFLTKELLNIYSSIFSSSKMNIEIIAYVDKNILKEVEKNFSKNIKKYNNNLKINGIKIFLDGSPQAKTAWVRKPYEGEESNYGYGTMNDAQVLEAIETAYNKQMQILAHCNGDKAIEQYIKAIKSTKKEIKRIRPVLIHGQLMGLDQLKDIKDLEIIPSYFVAHTYYWGDIHIKNLGIERANNISPTNSTKKQNIIFTLHQDSPVIEPNMLETIWCAVNRKTLEGKTIGEMEKIEVLDAIKAVTINAAYQYFEEKQKGSIKEGKYADLIILDKNPLKVKKEEIKKLKC